MIDEKEFTFFVKEGWTVKELQEYYGLSRTRIYDYKNKWNLTGLTPNGKALINSDTGTKVCGKCSEEKSLSDFYANGYTSKGKKKYKANCKPCEGKISYTKKKELITNSLDNLGREYKCERCGYDKNTAALCFHHLDPTKKDFEISVMSSYSKTEVEQEIDKCIVLCHNCHMEEHYPHLNK